MNAKYFSDINGTTTEIPGRFSMRNEEFAKKFPGIKGKRDDGFSRMVGTLNGEVFPITRVIFYKGRPSLHECNAKCRGGKCGGVCECQCGGKNHGVACAA